MQSSRALGGECSLLIDDSECLTPTTPPYVDESSEITFDDSDIDRPTRSPPHVDEQEIDLTLNDEDPADMRSPSDDNLSF